MYHNGTAEPDFTLNEAQSLYRKFAGKDGDEAARAMLDIAAALAIFLLMSTT